MAVHLGLARSKHIAPMYCLLVPPLITLKETLFFCLVVACDDVVSIVRCVVRAPVVLVMTVMSMLRQQQKLFLDKRTMGSAGARNDVVRLLHVIS